MEHLADNPGENTETVLFVDDEAYIADVAKEMLEDFGYRVDVVTRPGTALERFKASPRKYGLVITDYSMPEMTGDRFIREIRKIRPGIPVVMCSGVQPPPEVVEKIHLTCLLIKPFDIIDLLETVRGVFDLK